MNIIWQAVVNLASVAKEIIKAFGLLTQPQLQAVAR